MLYCRETSCLAFAGCDGIVGLCQKVRHRIYECGKLSIPALARYPDRAVSERRSDAGLCICLHDLASTHHAAWTIRAIPDRRTPGAVCDFAHDAEYRGWRLY